ncbi:MAG: polysaccharide deacetylase family protein [bacterium]
MASRIYIFLIVILVTAIIALAGLFYWSFVKTQDKLNNVPNESAQNYSNLPSTEKEIATTSPPFVVNGEISRANPAKKQVIFTFDAGAGTNSLQKILEVTKQHNVNVTFFSTGKFAETNPELIKQISSDGHEIFNHTYSHLHLTQLTDQEIKDELDKTEQIISGLIGRSTKPYFRPPYGDRNAHVLEIAAQEGYQSVFWSCDALDWMVGQTEQQVKDKIYSCEKPGAIILMHVGDDITGSILDEVFTKIENDGYQIISLTTSLN